MAESYWDISGPVTAVIIFTVKEDRADRVAKMFGVALAENVRRAKAGEMRGYLGLDCTRYGNKFAVWERYADADACNRLLPENAGNFVGQEGPDLFAEPPSFLFYPTDGLGVPNFSDETNK